MAMILETPSNETLWWCLMQLQGDPEDHTRFPYSILFEFLDAHLASTNAKERSRLDEILCDKLSDYATIIHMLQAVRMHHPKCSIRNLHEVVKVEDRLAWRRSKASKVIDLDTTVLGFSMDNFIRISLAHGPWNTKWLEKLSDSHAALQGYWKSVHSHFMILNELQELSDCDNKRLLQPIEIWSSDKYRSLLTTKQESVRQAISRKKRDKTPNNDTFLPLAKVPNDNNFVPLPSGPDLPTRPELPETRVKEKTRGITDVPPLPTTDTPTQDDIQSVTIPLNKRSVKVFSSIFPTSHEERSQTISWDTFVSSMEDAGFKARSGGGSIFIFEKMNGSGRINFHRPNPDPTLDPIMLQTIGRRMNKWFGWTRDIFEIAGN